MRQSVSRSHDDKDGGSVSIASQLHAVERWCEAHDATLIGFHSDVDESGASFNRKGLDEFLDDVERLRPDQAIFWDIKRLTRSLRLFLDIFEKLEAVDCQMVSVTEGTRHPPFVWRLLALMAEEERTRISQSITHGKREATKRGRHLGPAPLGYVRDDDGVLAIDPDTVWIPEWMFARALEGWTPTRICREANARGIPTTSMLRARREGGRRGCEGSWAPAAAIDATSTQAPISRRPPPILAPSTIRANGNDVSVRNNGAHNISGNVTRWSRETVTALLRRPTYAGLVESGRASRSRYGQSLGIVRAEGTHPAIVPRPQWEAVQDALDGQRLPSRRRGSPHWLAGRVTCAACGSRMYYVDANRSGGHEASAGGHGASTGRDRYWRCRRSYHATFGRDNEACPAAKARLSDRIVSALVRDALSGLLRHAADPHAVYARLLADRGASARTEREALERELAELQAQRIAIMDNLQARIGDRAEWARRDAAAIARMDRTLAALAALPEPVPLVELTDAAAVVRRFADLGDVLTDAQLAALAVALGLRVAIDAVAGTVRLSFRQPYAVLFG